MVVMKHSLVGIILLLMCVEITAGAVCSDSALIPNLHKRTRTYQVDGERGSDPYLSDHHLFPGWYSAVYEAEQWLMPDIYSAPNYSTCGTLHPIYLQDLHPDIYNLTEEPVTLVACEWYPFDPCLNNYHIYIRKCGDEVQYYLKGTSSNSAFCFDPPALQNVTDPPALQNVTDPPALQNVTDPPALQNVTDLYTDAPTVQLGKLEVSPELRFYKNGSFSLPSLTFVCVETGGGDRSGLTLTYTTYWYIDDKLLFTFENKSGLSPLSEQDLLSKGISLGIQVRCGAKLAKSITGLKSGLTTSDNFFAGVKVSESSVVMSKDDIKTLSFQPTIPYGCYGEENNQLYGDCKTKIHMIVPFPNLCELDDTNLGGLNPVFYKQDLQIHCGFEIFGCYPYESSCDKTMQPVSMNITTPFFSNDDPDTYRFKLVAQEGGDHEIWKGYTLDDVVIRIRQDNNYKNKVCFSHVDPHMQTADGKIYENNDFEGQFILYWNTRYNIMVQERTTRCNRNRAFCTCAVAVRAGGDIFLINLCNDLKFIGMTSCKDHGALVIEKYSEFDYEVLTNIGTLIKIKIRPHAGYDELMNIDITMAPKDYEAIKGLCGTFDSNSGNDFHDRNGNPLHDRLKFIKTWQLLEKDVNYLHPTCKSNVKTWVEQGQQLFCYCNCYGGTNTCSTIETEDVCSPSQFINCTVPLQKTENFCNEYTDKCLISNRKRRSSFTIDPEKEMKRRAALAETRRLVRKMRQSDGHYKLSIEEEGQDRGWIEAHIMAMNDAVKVGFKRNANYTEAHRDELVEFKRQYCPSDCRGNGNCTDKGVCSCTKDYFGPDCGNHIRQAPQIEDIEGGGVCDISTGSECKCFDVQVDALAETFFCRRNTQMVYLNTSSLTTDMEDVGGFYKNFFTGECCFESHREKHPLEVNSDVAFSEFQVSLSNDGSNFGPVVTLHIFDSLCQEIITGINGQTTVRLKINTCLINENCYEENDVELDSKCLKCLPGEAQLKWTNVCTTSQTSDGIDVGLVVGCAVAGFIVIALVSIIYVVCFKKQNRDLRTFEVFDYMADIRENIMYYDEEETTT